MTMAKRKERWTVEIEVELDEPLDSLWNHVNGKAMMELENTEVHIVSLMEDGAFTREGGIRDE
jgi:restriction endonuclease